MCKFSCADQQAPLLAIWRVITNGSPGNLSHLNILNKVSFYYLQTKSYN